MKMKFYLLVLAASLPLVTQGQSPNPVVTNSVPTGDATLKKNLPVAPESLLIARPAPAMHVSGMEVSAEGALVRAARAGQVWQAVNPFAPAEFGDGFDNVTLDHHTKQPTGIVLVSLRFGSTRHPRP
jgi:hypothetical protein